MDVNPRHVGWCPHMAKSPQDPAVQAAVQQIADLLLQAQIDPGLNVEVEVGRLVKSAVRRVADLQRQATGAEPAEPMRMSEAVGRTVKRLRNAADMKQEALGQAMVRLGFDWNRQTVVEVERARRRLTHEELVAMAALFSVPVAELLLVDIGEAVQLNDHTIVDAEELAVLCAPNDIDRPGWIPPSPRIDLDDVGRRVCDTDAESDWRPIVHLRASAAARSRRDI